MNPIVGQINKATGYTPNLGAPSGGAVYQPPSNAPTLLKGPFGPVDGSTGYTPPNNSGGNTGGTSGGSHTLAPPPDPGIAIANELKGQIGSRMADLNNIYNSIYGQIDQSAQSQRSTMEKDYTNQFQTLQDQYGQNMRSLPWLNASRGLAGSSFEANDEADAGRLFHDNNGAIQNDENAKLASLAGYVNQQKATFHGQQDALGQYNLGMYPSTSGSLYGLQSLYNNLVGQEAQAKASAGGFGSDSSFMQGLNAIAPSQNQGASQLQQQLSTLKQANLPGFASDQVASAIINKNTQQDPNQANYWLNYYNNSKGA